ncbi:guanine nucleotide exchange factor SDO1 [Sugiyamaella lignohabitans]|uniref:Guanine nucleotide exchange factor SDO1 n=1 Tax=Sugiyamaella lignohabitans TaxID=796027 RepID=A0A167ER49_9ASCO|nr:guanine nucleotide exchange factor SDO1 [Sugiyamaella lignohabitans]ANB14374.1 guanine nucleotide exchange factor SDO1 [Sugiyamaella lignohabitans]
MLTSGSSSHNSHSNIDREKDLDEVLQIPQVFVHVSKGQVANNEDLKAAFGTTDQNVIIQEILKKGELQVGGKEREALSNQMHAEIIQLIAAKCVNPGTKRPYPTSIIDKALSESNFNMVPNKSAKIQALDAIKLLMQSNIIPIVRARMKVLIRVDSSKDAKKFSDKVKALTAEIDDEDWSGKWELTAFIDPGNFRILDELIQKETKGRGSVEVLDTAVVKEGDQDL